MQLEQDPHQIFLQTLAYANVFSAPLELWQLQRYALSDRPISVSALTKEWYHWHSQTPNSEPRPFSQAPSPSPMMKRRKWQEVQRAVRVLRWVPWITSIWVTGSVAIGNAQEADDIDFMIITSPHCLWTARIAASGLGWLSGHLRRRYHTLEQVNNKWCLNVWLDAADLTLPGDRHDLYSARELVQARPVYQRFPAQADRYIAHNAWVKDFSYPGWLTARERARRQASLPPLLWQIPGLLAVFTWLGRGLNRLAFRWQCQHMEGHRQQEWVTPTAAFFHPQLRSPAIQQEYERIMVTLSSHTYV